MQKFNRLKSENLRLQEKLFEYERQAKLAQDRSYELESRMESSSKTSDAMYAAGRVVAAAAVAAAEKTASSAVCGVDFSGNVH